MRRILVILSLSATTLPFSACSFFESTPVKSVQDMSKEFACDYQVTYRRSTDDSYDFEQIIQQTYPQWYSDGVILTDERKAYTDEWGRLILSRNGLTSGAQVTEGEIYKVPVRCEELDRSNQTSTTSSPSL